MSHMFPNSAMLVSCGNRGGYEGFAPAASTPEGWVKASVISFRRNKLTLPIIISRQIIVKYIITVEFAFKLDLDQIIGFNTL